MNEHVFCYSVLISGMSACCYGDFINIICRSACSLSAVVWCDVLWPSCLERGCWLVLCMLGSAWSGQVWPLHWFTTVWNPCRPPGLFWQLSTSTGSISQHIFPLMIFQEAGLSRSKVQPTLAAQGFGQSKRDLTGGIHFYLMFVAVKELWSGSQEIWDETWLCLCFWHPLCLTYQSGPCGYSGQKPNSYYLKNRWFMVSHKWNYQGKLVAGLARSRVSNNAIQPWSDSLVPLFGTSLYWFSFQKIVLF